MEPAFCTRAVVAALKKAIAGSKLSKSEIARRAGITRQALYPLKNPTLTTLSALCRVLRLKIVVSRLK